MNAEKIIEMIKGMGGGVFVIFAVLIGAYLIVAFMRMSQRKKQSPHSDADPSGEP